MRLAFTALKRGDKKTKHICAPDKCVHCRERLTGQGSHQCFIQPLEPKEPCEKYIFYDFETRYENGRHVANFVCAITFKGRNLWLRGTDCIAKLINRFRHPRYNGYCFIAHYASRFDAFLILEYFCKAGIAIEVIMQGCKIIFMYDESFGQRYIDSYSFFPMALAKMPVALDLTTTEKGYFPHLFNRVETRTISDHTPTKSSTTTITCRIKTVKSLMRGTAQLRAKWFDFRKELYAYGVNDVVLLREGCMKYREAFMQCAGLDPFGFATLAGCSMGVFKTPLSRQKHARSHA